VRAVGRDATTNLAPPPGCRRWQGGCGTARLGGSCHARTRSVRDTALVVLEKPMAPNPIRMEAYLKAPSQPLLHKLGVSPLYEAETDGLPHVRHERPHLDTHARKRACPLIMY